VSRTQVENRKVEHGDGNPPRGYYCDHGWGRRSSWGYYDGGDDEESSGGNAEGDFKAYDEDNELYWSDWVDAVTGEDSMLPEGLFPVRPVRACQWMSMPSWPCPFLGLHALLLQYFTPHVWSDSPARTRSPS
jgi:hypothetical protein